MSNRTGIRNGDDYMDLSFITQLYVPIVLVACLICGYILKHWIKDVDNKWIPTILAVLGAVISCIASWNIDLITIVAGAFTGLASTGMHQLFKQIVEAPKRE